MDVKMERGFHGFNTDGHGCEKGDADTRRLNGVTQRGLPESGFTIFEDFTRMVFEHLMAQSG
mgnify:FL=1